MFRLVTSGVVKPTLFLLCDSPHCIASLTADFEAAEPHEYEALRAEFILKASEAGWLVRLEGSYCQICARPIMKAAEQAQNRVAVARGREIAAFGKVVSR